MIDINFKFIEENDNEKNKCNTCVLLDVIDLWLC